MRRLSLNLPTTLTLHLKELAGSSSKPGLIFSDISLYLRKPGQPPQLKTLTANTFTEVSSSLLPGVYEVSLESSDVDSAGELVLLVAENVGADLAQYVETLSVGSTTQDSREAFVQSLVQNTDSTTSLLMQRDQRPLEGLTLEDVEVDVYLNGSLKSNSISESFTPLGKGLYAIKIPPEITSKSGDLLVRLRPFEDFNLSATSQNLTGFSGTQIYAAPNTRSSSLIVIADSSDATQVSVSNDRGDSFSPVTFPTGSGAREVYGVGGDPDRPLVYAISAYDFNSNLAYSYYTEDGGVTFTESSDLSSNAVSATGSLNFLRGTDSYVMLAQLSAGGSVLLSGGVGGTTSMSSSFTTPSGTNLRDVSSATPSVTVVSGDLSGASYIRFKDGGPYSVASSIPNVGILYGVSMAFGTTIGWAVGENGGVIKTTDGGDTWSDQTSNLGVTVRLNSAFAVDGNTCYVVGEGASFYVTNDGGASWSTPPEITALSLFDDFLSVSVADSAVYALSYSSLMSFELGKKFSKFDTTLSRFQITPAESSPSDVEIILTSLRAELTRKEGPVQIPTSVLQTFSTYLSYEGEALTGLNNVLIKSTLLKKGVFTANTISTSIQEINANDVPGWYTYNLTVSDTDTEGDLVVDFRSGPKLIESEVQTVPSTTNPVEQGISVYASDALTVYIGLKSDIGSELPIATLNGGDNWQEISTLGFSLYFVVRGFKDSDFVCVGSNNSGSELTYSDDAGSTWNTASDPSFTVFDSVTDLTVVSTSLVYMIAGSYILSWKRESSSNLAVIFDSNFGSQIFYAIGSFEESLIIAVGDSSGQSLLMLSQDGGASWTEPALPSSSSSLRGISIRNDEVWVVGQAGVVFYSSDGGASYSAISIGVVADLYCVHVTPSGDIWIGGDSTLTLSQDGGTTWATPASLTSLIASKNFKGIDSVSEVLWFTGEDVSGTAVPFIIQVTVQEQKISPSTFRFFVNTPSSGGGGSVDLSSVTTALNEIKGAGFDTLTDSLVGITAEVSSVDTKADSLGTQLAGVVTQVTNANTQLTEIKGAGFVSSNHALSELDLTSSGGSTDLTPVLTALSDLDVNVSDLDVNVSQIDAKVDAMALSVTRLLGLSQENYRITNQTYNSDNKLTSASLRLFGNKTDTNANSSPIATYSVSATYNGTGLLIDYKVTQES